MRQSRRRQRLPEILLVYPYIDLFLGMRLVLVGLDPTYGVKLAQLPVIQPGEATQVDAPQMQRREIHVQVDGTILWQNQAVTCESLVEHLKSELLGDEMLVLILEHRDGQGSVESFFRIQMTLSQAGFWPRVHVLCRTEAPHPPPSQESTP